MIGETKIRRALSLKDLMAKKYDTFPFEGAWYDAFKRPERTGVWFVWGGSTNGKTSFMTQLCCELAKYDRIIYNSLEEGTSLSMQEAFMRVNPELLERRILFSPGDAGESMEQLSARLSARKSPGIAVIDSFHAAELDFKKYKRFKAAHPDKLLIFTSLAEGRQPMGRPAGRARFDATLKIWVEGFVAHSMGRFIGPTGKYVIWEEGARRHWGDAV